MAELKVRLAKKFMMARGYTHWTNVLGLRADEGHRVLRSVEDKSQRWVNVCPLAQTGVTRRDVSEFWKVQGFDMGFPDNEGRTPLGNFDGCMLKSERNRAALIRDYPDRAAWWSRMEDVVSDKAGKMATFDKRTSWSTMTEYVHRQGDWVFEIEGGLCDPAQGGA